MRIELTRVLEIEAGGSTPPRVRVAAAGLAFGAKRKLLLSLVTAVTLVALPAAAQAASKVTYQASSEQQVLTLLNQIRSQHKLTPFTASAPLRSAARAHSADMLRKGYFDHNSPTESWKARMARYVKSPLTSENIAWGQGSYGSAAGIVNLWMHSPTHRAIILTTGLHRVGLGLALGTYDGRRGTVMATADFTA